MCHPGGSAFCAAQASFAAPPLMQVSTPSLYPRRLPCTAMHVALEEMTLHMAVPCDKLAAVLPPQHLHRLLLTLVLRGTALHPSIILGLWSIALLPTSLWLHNLAVVFLSVNSHLSGCVSNRLAWRSAAGMEEQGANVVCLTDRALQLMCRDWTAKVPSASRQALMRWQHSAWPTASADDK